MLRSVVLFGLLMSLSLLVGCQPAAQTAQIQMGDFYFKPDVTRLKGGQQVRLEIINEGQLEHELMIGREVEMHEGEPEGFEKDFFEGIQVTHTAEKGHFMKEDHGYMADLEPGGKATLTFTAPADRKGEWEMACLYAGHYEAGMKAKFIID